MHFRKLWLLASVFAGIAYLGPADQASGGTIEVGFTHNGGAPATDYNLGQGGTDQLRVSIDISAFGVQVTLKNLTGGTSSAIMGFYFDGSDTLGTYDSFVNGDGVLFREGGAPPVFPSGGDLDPQFSEDLHFTAEKGGPQPARGINPGEFFDVFFTYAGDQLTMRDASNDALAHGDLRLGLQVISIKGGPSQQYVSVPPPPLPPPSVVVPTPSAALAGLVLMGGTLLRRRA